MTPLRPSKGDSSGSNHDSDYQLVSQRKLLSCNRKYATKSLNKSNEVFVNTNSSPKMESSHCLSNSFSKGNLNNASLIPPQPRLKKQKECVIERKIEQSTTPK